MAVRVDLLLKITKVVTTMITKSACIPVAQINGLRDDRSTFTCA